MASSSDEPLAAARDSTAMAVLVANHRAFLRYLERRTHSREAAEDLLQDAFARNLDRLEALPGEAVVPWFYRVLRNAVIDRARRAAVADRALERLRREMAAAEAVPPDLHGEICACVRRLAGTLKPEYAEALLAIDVEGVAVKAFAEDHGLTPANAGVRVFRARQALRRQVTASCGTCAEHGCLDCSCGRIATTGV